MSAKETTADAQEVTGRLKWLEIHIKARPGAATEAVSAGADRVCEGDYCACISFSECLPWAR